MKYTNVKHENLNEGPRKSYNIKFDQGGENGLADSVLKAVFVLIGPKLVDCI